MSSQTLADDIRASLHEALAYTTYSRIRAIKNEDGTWTVETIQKAVDLLDAHGKQYKYDPDTETFYVWDCQAFTIPVPKFRWDEWEEDSKRGQKD